MTTWISDVFTSDVGWTHLENLVDIGNRMAGSDGEREAAELTRDALAEAGARNARLESFDIQGWTRGDSAVVAPDEELECIALPRSPSDEATGELVDLGYGLPEDFEDADLEGKIAMVRSDIPEYYERYIHRREKYYHAVDQGAVGFVYRNHVEGCLPPTGSVGTKDDPIGDIPAVGVSSEVGARLARRYDGEEIAVSVEADIDDATSQNIHAELGPETDERVLVTSHVDAHDIAEGALDNGAGTAMVVELANALAAREDELETRVEFVAYGAEEVGLVGSGYHAEQADHGSIKAIVNNDGVVRGRTLSLTTHGFPELEAAAEEVAERHGHPIETVPQLGPHSDHWPFVQWGVPGYHVMSTSDEVGRGWGHTFADTLEKIEKRTLREQAILLTELTVDLAREEQTIEHREPAEIAADLEDQNLAEGSKITGDWPYDN
ncbi:putative M28 family peptidase (homolog to aminopeptidase YwaD) [Natrialba magadii ATCC 43099]|uniref:Carboxypeptidase Q n=1 Tax=Natrialba magadii (strain ATCC 43099 / DSM 3394 / CCM 3739 / CIP 104546 / IAM 13178 / JCM 8861 / NBRC 102185 / NCIMB 2190 / MS3) TaxID=547559 RepID=D3SS17_NATMM|nr:M28 family peptidase [Natrialba magadii]ADD06791.1 putative M28 family peptidase (homolog to aminopeptidase YwaD) [Natrialba magadii ATCC 43099]ELY27773.1 peptidase M28 [Natrialba magadii ATCC 43099]